MSGGARISPEGAAGRGWWTRRVVPVVLAVLLAGCTARLDGHVVDGLDPAPLRVAGIAAIGVGSVLHLYDGDGAPASRPVAAARANRDGTVTWLGHAGVLVRLAGRAVMIDPMLSEGFDVPLPLGPRRVAAVPDIAGLDRLDAVAISHIDHDHFDLPTLAALAKRFPGARLLLPRGTAERAAGLGFAAVEEVGEGEAVALGRLRVGAVVAYHHGRRDMIGFDRTPAVGWVIEGGGRRIYHSGDTAYGPGFRALRRHGRIDLALVPVGAYRPAGFFRNMHASPEEAVEIARDLGARRAIPHHWGTFSLGPESPMEAIGRFRAAAKGRIETRVLAVGETMAIGRQSLRATGRR